MRRRIRDHHAVYLVTVPISTMFLRGQLGHLIANGCTVTLGCAAGPAELDEGVVRVEVPFVREPAPLTDLRSLVAVCRLLRRERPCVVHASTPKAGLVGTVGAWLCRVPVRVYEVRGLRFETLTGRSRTVFKWTERIAMRLATNVVFNSRSTLAIAERERLLPPGRGEVWGAGSSNGIDVRRFDDLPSVDDARAEAGIPAGAEVIGFAARLTKDKGIGDAAAVFERLAAERPDLWFLVVGSEDGSDPPDPTVLPALRAHPRVRMAGWVEHPARLLRAMDLLLFPSYREGLPNVPLEAQCCRVPVVGYAASGTVDAVRDGHTGSLVPVGDIDALAAATGDLLDDPARRSAMGDEGRTWVEAEFRQELLWDQALRAFARYRAASC